MFVKLYNICNSPAAEEGWKERRKEYYHPHHVQWEKVASCLSSPLASHNHLRMPGIYELNTLGRESSVILFFFLNNVIDCAGRNQNSF